MQDEKVRKALDKANSKLKGHGVNLEISGKHDNLYIRGVLPNKPTEKPGKSQRRVSLKRRALTVEDIRWAEQEAIAIGLDLRRGEFDWAKFCDFEDPAIKMKSIGYFAKEFEAEKSKDVSADTWRYNYLLPMQSLPVDEELTEERMYQWILEQDPECSTSRRKYVGIARSLLEMADLPTKKIMKLSKEVSAKAVNPRNLPEDSQIEAMWQFIAEQEEEWAAVYGMLATYGLRPHELFKIDLAYFPEIRVLPETKTGERIVPPIYPEWVDRFQLSKNFVLPSNLKWDMELPNWKLGRKIGNRFRKYNYGDPYDLRHCYARRLLVCGVSSDIGAKLLGHSRQIHESTYRAFVKSSVYLEAARRIINQYQRDE